MKHSVAAVLLSMMAVAVVAQQKNPADTPPRGTIQLQAKVIAVGQIGEFSGQVFPVDIDPRFALTMRIETVTPETAELKPDSQVTFAIHSPALVFGDAPQKGRSYKFDLCRENVNGKVKFSRLGVHFQGGSIGGCS